MFREEGAQLLGRILWGILPTSQGVDVERAVPADAVPHQLVEGDEGETGVAGKTTISPLHGMVDPLLKGGGPLPLRNKFGPARREDAGEGGRKRYGTPVQLVDRNRPERRRSLLILVVLLASGGSSQIRFTRPRPPLLRSAVVAAECWRSRSISVRSDPRSGTAERS